MNDASPIENCLQTILAGGALRWFCSLQPLDQEKYQRLCEEYAEKFYRRSLSELTKDEHERVHELVRRHYPR